MPPPDKSAATGGRLSGLDICNYMEKYYELFVKEKATFKFNTEVVDISRDEGGTWLVRTENLQTGAKETLKYCRIILGTGVSHMVDVMMGAMSLMLS